MTQRGNDRRRQHVIDIDSVPFDHSRCSEGRCMAVGGLMRCDRRKANSQRGPTMKTFTSQPPGGNKWAKKVWIAARFLIGAPPSSMTMIPTQTWFRGDLTKTTKWIINHDDSTLPEPIEIDGPSGEVYEALLKMTRDEQ